MSPRDDQRQRQQTGTHRLGAEQSLRLWIAFITAIIAGRRLVGPGPRGVRIVIRCSNPCDVPIAVKRHDRGSIDRRQGPHPAVCCVLVIELPQNGGIL